MKKTFKILGLIIFSILHMCNIGYSQTVVKDSITEFKVPLSSGTFVFNKQDGRIWQLNEKSAGTGTLATTTKREVTSKYALVDSVLQLRNDISAQWRSDISDSIAATHPTFAEILEKNNNAGDTTITGLRGFGDGSVISSGSYGISAHNGQLLNNSRGIATHSGILDKGIGIAAYSGTITGGSVGIAEGGGTMTSSFGLARNSGIMTYSAGIATNGGILDNVLGLGIITGNSSATYADAVISNSYQDTIREDSQKQGYYVSLNGRRNLIEGVGSIYGHKQVFLANADSSTITNGQNFIGLNLQNRTYTGAENVTVIDRNLMLPGIDVAAQDSVLYIATDGNITKGLGYNGSQLLSQFNLSISTSAPSSATDIGIKGEIRITATHIYICIDTDTWVRTEITTW